MRYIREVLRKNRSTVILYVAMGIFIAFLTSFKANYFQRVVDGLADGTLALGSILFYGLIMLTDYVVNYLEEYPNRKLEHGLYLDFKLMALRKISRIDYLEYQKIGVGKLVQRIENGATAGRDVVFNFWLRLIRELAPGILFSVLFIWRINRTVTAVLLAGYVVVFIITNILLKFLYQIKERILNNEEMLNHFLVRGFMEMLVFRMKRQFPGEIRKAEAAKQDIVRTKAKMRMIHEAFFAAFAVLVGLIDVIVLIYAWKTGSLSVGAAVALITLIGNAYTPIAIFNVIYVDYKLDKAAYARLEEFLDSRDDGQLHAGSKPGAMKGDVQVQDLSFSYGDRTIFDGLNLSIRSGERVAFVGESGSGKSTLVKLLVGLLKYDSGSIRLDGTELKQLCLDELYGRVSYISQDSPVFDGTIRENLVFDRKVSDAELLDALEHVKLSYLPESAGRGLDAEIGERGTTLSGGEKQRLALARLWFEDPAIVILDEATSAMDNLTEESVMSAVIDRLQGRTVIAIAHRLSSVAGFDRIVVFRDGRIAAQGTFDELMRTDDYFVELYNASAQQ